MLRRLSHLTPHGTTGHDVANERASAGIPRPHRSRVPTTTQAPHCRDGQPDMNSTAGHAGPDDAAPRRVRFTPFALLVAAVLGAYAVGRAVYRLDDVVGLVVTAVVVAVVTKPVQRRLSVVGDGLAIALTALLSLVVSLVVAFVALRDLRTQAAAVAHLVNEHLASVEASSTAGRVISSLRIESAIAGWLARVPDLVVVGEENGAGVGKQLIALVTVIILAAFLQSSGKHMVDWFVSLWPRTAEETPASEAEFDPSVNARSEMRQLLDEIDRRGIGAVRRAALLALGCAAVVTLTCQLLGEPGAVVLGIWAGAWFAVPTIGWAVGLLPIGIVVWVGGTTRDVVALTLVIVVAVAATSIRRRFVDRATIRLGVGPHVVALAIGVAMGGVVGSIIGLAVVASLGVVASTERTISAPSPWLLEAGRTRTIGGVEVPTGWRAAVLAATCTAIAVVAWLSAVRATEAVVWLLIGTFVAVALSRPVGWMVTHLHVRRHAAIALLLVSLGSIAVLVVITGASNGANASTSVADQLPGVVRDLEDTPVIGSWLRDRNASVWIEDQVNDLPQRVRTVQPAEWLPAVGARVMDLFWTTLVAVALLIDGRRIVDRSSRIVPARGRRQFIRLTGAVGRALGGYAAGAALVAGINGIFVFATAILLGIGLAPILAAWAFVWNFVPQIGGFIGGIPLILFALVAGPTQALIAGVAFVIYQFVENNLIQPTVIGAAIDVPPWGTLLAALAGAAAAGVIGAIVVTPLVGVVRVIRSELDRDDFPGATVTVEPDTAA